jgi:hypothetical protein
MNMALEVAPPRRRPVSPQKKPLSPHKKRRPSSSCIAITPTSSRVANFNSSTFCISDKNVLVQSFSELNLDDFLDEEEREQHDQKQAFIASVVEFLEDDKFVGDSKFKKMCTEWEASTDAVPGGTEEEVEFNTDLASLFVSFSDLFTSKRSFGKKECSTIQQEMERLKKIRRQMAMSADCKPDASGFLQDFPHSPTALSRKKERMLGRQYEQDAAQLQLQEQKRGTEGRGDSITPERLSSQIEYGGEPVASRSRSPIRRSEGNRPSLQSRTRPLHKSSDDNDDAGVNPHGTSLKISQGRSCKQRGPLGNPSCHLESPRTRSGPAAALHTPPSRKGDNMIPSGVSGHASRSMPALMSPRKASSTSWKGDNMSLIRDASDTGRSMLASSSPGKSSRKSAGSDTIRSSITTTRSRSGASPSVQPQQKFFQMDPQGVSFLQMDPLGVSDSIGVPITPRRLRSTASSTVKTLKSPWDFPQTDPIDMSESTPAPITPIRLRSEAYTAVKSPRLPEQFLNKDPRGVLESIRAEQLHGTPRRFTGKGSTRRIGAKLEQSLFSEHHFLARLHDRSVVPDSPKTSRASQGGRPRAQSQAPRPTLSNHEMFSNRDMLVFKLNL